MTIWSAAFNATPECRIRTRPFARVFLMPRLIVAHALVLAFLAPVVTLARTDGQDAASPPTTRGEILQREREAKAGRLEPYRISRAEARVRFLETWRLPRRLFAKGYTGFRPVMGGMPSGSGFVGGGGCGVQGTALGCGEDGLEVSRRAD